MRALVATHTSRGTSTTSSPTPSRTCSWVVARWKRDLTQVDFEPAGAELVAATHFTEGVRTIGAFAHAAVQVDVCGSDHRHRQGKRDGRQHQPASPARECGDHQCRADRDHRPGGEPPVDTRKPRACHREQDRPGDDGRSERETAE